MASIMISSITDTDTDIRMVGMLATQVAEPDSLCHDLTESSTTRHSLNRRVSADPQNRRGSLLVVSMWWCPVVLVSSVHVAVSLRWVCTGDLKMGPIQDPPAFGT